MGVSGTERVTNFEDECWWSRLALPAFSSWAEEGKPMRLIQRPASTTVSPGATLTR